MGKSLLKRTLAGLALAGTLLVATPAIASADMMVLVGTSSRGYYYMSAETLEVILSPIYRGGSYFTDCMAPKS